jgi:hypothetical protein
MRERNKTAKQAEKQQAQKLAAPGFDLRATIGSGSVQAQTAPLAVPITLQAPVDLHTDLGSQQPSKRSRPEQSSGAQPPKRPAFDIRDGLPPKRSRQ